MFLLAGRCGGRRGVFVAAGADDQAVPAVGAVPDPRELGRYPVVVDVLHIDGCASLRAAGRNLRDALAELGLEGWLVRFVEIASPAQAVTAGFGGSPTFLVDGRDVFGGPRVHALACRTYLSPDGLRGAPTVSEFVEALRGVRGGGVR